MAVTYHTLTGDVTDILGVDFPLDRVTGASLETNLPKDAALVADGKVRLPSIGKLNVQADGTFSIANLVASDSADTNVDPDAPLLYRVSVRYRHPQTARARGGNVVETPVWSSPWFELNGSGTTTLANVVEVAYLPASLVSQATATLEAARDDAVSDVQAAGTTAITTATTQANRAETEADRSTTEADRSEQAAADAEALVISDLGTTDGQTRALIESTSSQTYAALSAQTASIAFAKSPLNALQRGLTPAATAADNATKLAELIAEARTEGRALYFSSTDEDTLIQGTVPVGGVVLTGAGEGTRLRQAALTGLPLLRVDQTGTVIEGLHLSSAAVRDTAWATSGGNNSAVILNEAMHDTTVQGVIGENWTSVVHAPGGTTPTRRLSTHQVTGLNVGFVVNGRGLLDFEIIDTRGSISFDKTNETSAPPHHVYIAAVMDGTIPDSQSGIVRGVLGWDSPDSSAAVKADHWRGGTISDVVVRDCCGLVTIDGCTDVYAERLVAIDDNLSGTPAVYVCRTGGTSERIRVRDVLVRFKAGDHAVGLHIKDTVDAQVDDVTIFTNRTTTTSQGAILAEGNNPRIRNARVGTLGAGRTNPAVRLVGTNGAQVRGIRSSGTVYAVELASACVDTTLEYDPRDISLIANAASTPFTKDAGSETPLVLTPTLPRINEDRPAAWFSAAARGPVAEAALAGWQSGQAATVQGTWRWAAAAAGIYNQDNQSNAAAWIDPGFANHRVEALVKYAGVGVGVVARLTDNNNHLSADVTATGIVLSKRVAGTVTSLGTGGPAAIDTGRRCRIGLAVCGNTVEVYLDGSKVIDHQLTGGDETTFAGATKVGLHARTASAARFLSATVQNLTA